MAIEVVMDDLSEQPNHSRGRFLYERHIDAHAVDNCIIDSWDELTDDDRVVWGKTAESVILKDSKQNSLEQQAWAWEQIYGTLKEMLPDLFPLDQRISGCERVLGIIKYLYAASVKPDTYDLQRDLMLRSAQDLPTQVCITPQAIMYFALNLEELGETATAMGDAIHAGLLHPTDDHALSNAASVQWADGFSQSADAMVAQGSMLKQYARGMRENVKHYFGQALPRVSISLPHAVEIADGCVDVAVVNAGLTLSLGLPGKECYDNVVLSNLSKQQDDGVIHKYPDGKWIKGPNHKEPQLASIVEPLLWKPDDHVSGEE